jgi:hypothetical protein
MKKGVFIALFALAATVTVFAFSGKAKNQATEKPKNECSQPSKQGENPDCCDYQPECCIKKN